MLASLSGTLQRASHQLPQPLGSTNPGINQFSLIQAAELDRAQHVFFSQIGQPEHASSQRSAGDGDAFIQAMGNWGDGPWCRRLPGLGVGGNKRGLGIFAMSGQPGIFRAAK
jgi:hypothetical protein